MNFNAIAYVFKSRYHSASENTCNTFGENFLSKCLALSCVHNIFLIHCYKNGVLRAGGYLGRRACLPMMSNVQIFINWSCRFFDICTCPWCAYSI